jgi:poly(3-hydroxybutyrate) depolymerase
MGGIMTCMSGGPSGQMSWLAAQGFATLGQIDPVAGVAAQKVYVYSGTKDSVVKPTVVQATRDYYQAAGVAKANLAYVNTVPSGHAFIAPTFGNICATNAAPYIDQCMPKGSSANYDQPKAILQHIYGTLKPAAASLSSTVRPFDQRAFASADTGLDSVGYYYVPKTCATDSSACSVHVVFHGCKQGAAVVGSDVYSKVGYNQWADSNHVIVVYPQILASQMSPMNPDGCWDWWGYSGTNFQVKSGPQMSAVKAMVDRLTSQN